MDQPLTALAIGQRLRQARHAKGWTLKQASRESGRCGRHLPAVVIGSYERADRRLTAVRLVELAELYDADAGWILTGHLTLQRPDPVTEAGLELARRARQLAVAEAGLIA